jgi:hypothetical protein
MNTKELNEMDKKTTSELVHLRLIVGYLGEKQQFNWWPSDFLNATTKKIFEFTFPRTASLAQYEAVSAASAKVHDGSIGIGKSFHLFRLPEFIEKSLLKEIQSADSAELEGLIVSKDVALRGLTDLAASASLSGEGPINIGQVTDSSWEKSISKLAAAYLQAFNSNSKAYPYFQGES